MSEKIYDVPAEWAKRAWIDDAKYQRDVCALDQGPERLLGRAGQAHRLDQAASPRSRTSPSRPATSRSNGSRTASSTSPRTASTGISTSAATRPRSSGKATTPRSPGTSPTGSCTTRSARFANILRTRNVKKGDRVTIYLPMIPEAAYAMLACARIGAIHSVVFARLLARQPRRAHQRLPVQGHHHRRRGPARRQEGAAEGQCRCRARQGRRRRLGRRGQAHRRRRST